jgi:hypothetical protein
MRDWGGAHTMQQWLLAEKLGLAMARRAADILDRHRREMALAAPGGADDAQFTADDAIFTAVLDAANDCIGRFDTRPSEERWCDALVHLLLLARLAPDED